MLTAARLAGFFTAHAIWCVSDGEDGDTITPMLASTDDKGERELRRLAMDDMQQAVAHGQQLLQSNEMHAADAALLFDGMITNDDVKFDAIIVEFRCFAWPDASAVVAVPYSRPAGKFTVHNPKLLGWNNCDDFDVNGVITEFFEGVGEHEQGAKCWDNAMGGTA